MDAMQFYADLLTEILGESAPSSKNLDLKQSEICWPKTIVTDARDVYDKVSRLRKVGSLSRRLENGFFRCTDTLDCTRKYDHERSDEGAQRVAKTLGSNTARRIVE